MMKRTGYSDQLASSLRYSEWNPINRNQVSTAGRGEMMMMLLLPSLSVSQNLGSFRLCSFLRLQLSCLFFCLCSCLRILVIDG